MEGIENLNFPTLNKATYPREWAYPLDESSLGFYKHFGASYNKMFYFLPTNPKAEVAKMNIDNGFDDFHYIPKSKIPNVHVGSVYGVQVQIFIRNCIFYKNFGSFFLGQ